MADDERNSLGPAQQPPAEAEPEEGAAAEEPAPEEAGTQALAQALRGSFLVLKIAMVALVSFYLLKGIFYVGPQEVRFKLEFGRIVTSRGDKALKPGKMYIKWPWQEVVPVSIDEKTLDLPVEFWTDWTRAGSDKNALDMRRDGYLITGDANIVHMRLRLRYRVRDDATGAQAYLFAVDQPEQIVRRELAASTTKVVGGMKVMDVLRRGDLFEDIANDLRGRLQDFERKAGVPLGLEIIAVEAAEAEKVKNPSEPGRVRQAFFDAQNAGSEMDRTIEQAKSQGMAIVEAARARAEEMKAEAQGYRSRLVQAAEADAEQVAELLPIYQRSPEEADILREYFYQSTLESVLRDASGTFVLYKSPEGARREIRLLHGRRPRSTGPQQ